MLIQVGLKIRDDQLEWIKRSDLNLSKFLRNRIDEQMESSKKP